MRNSKDRSKIPSFHTTEQVQEFWNTHSVTQFEGKLREVPVNVRLKSVQHQVGIEPSLIARLRRIARARGLSTESLVNLWLHEKVSATIRKQRDSAIGGQPSVGLSHLPKLRADG